MSSLSKPRCARGMQCYHVTDLCSDGPAKVPREGDICSRCAELGPKPEDVPDKYRELFRAARVLFKEGETDEYTIIPTLAFAASSSEMPELRSVREQFAQVKDKYPEETAAQKSEGWMKLYDQFFYYTYTALQPLDVKEGVMIVRSSPMRAINVKDEESGLIDMVQIEVHRLSEPATAVASFYERNLRRIGIYYQEGRGDIGPRKLAPEREMIRIEARPEPGLRDPVGELGSVKWHQGPFPGPQLMGLVYDYLRDQRVKDLAEINNAAPRKGKKALSKKPYNLIPACVYWYVGNRGEVLRSPRDSDLKRTTYQLLKEHLLDPCTDEIQKHNKVRLDHARDAAAIEERILRVDSELRNS